MPVDMAMQEPWSGVVGNEAERHIVGSSADADRIPTHWVHEVVWRVTGNPDYIEIMLEFRIGHSSIRLS